MKYINQGKKGINKKINMITQGKFFLKSLKPMIVSMAITINRLNNLNSPGIKGR